MIKKNIDPKNNKFYIYAFLDTRKPKGKYYYKRSGEKYGPFEYPPFYIGKGQGKRITEHFAPAEMKREETTIKCRIINKIVKETGEFPVSIKIKENMSEEKAFKLEIKLIKIIGRIKLKNGPLSNLTDGGEGPSGLVAYNKGIPMPLAQRLKLSKGKKGIKLSEENKKAISKGQTKYTYELFSPRKKKFIITNLNEFCRNNNLDIANMCRLVNRKIKTYKGWSGRILIKPKNIKKRHNGGYKFIDPDGNIYITNNLRRFCKDYELTRFKKAHNKKYSSHLGWKIYEIKIKINTKFTHFYSKSSSNFVYWFKDPDGNVYEDIYSLSDFCKNHDLSLTSVYKAIKNNKPLKKNNMESRIWKIYKIPLK